MLLHEVPGVSPDLDDTAIAKSKIWNKDVENLHPTQLVAIRTKELETNPNSKIDEQLAHLTLQIQFAVLDDLCESPLIHYTRPVERNILASELIAGLKALEPEYRMALIFGLEMGLSAIRTANLTYRQAHEMENLTEMASSVLRSSTPSVMTVYMFWKREDGEHIQLYDLNEAVYGAFGMSWLDLALRYGNLIADCYNPLVLNS